MSRGKRLDLFIGADFKDEWAEVQTPKKAKASHEILLPAKHFLVFKREKRRAKVVTLVGEFHLKKEDANAVLKLLKKRVGCGGTYKEGWMEFQGELQEKLREQLTKEGFRFKRQ